MTDRENAFNLLNIDISGLDEKCEDCVYIADLRHNYKYGFKESFCCIHFPLCYREGYVVEVSLNDRCECFKRRLPK